ncbi:unnamed protein product [Lactuca saligna]|uniref:histone deacetylase n=1 Tax=Lactuca saligna TaxID=75948 RepID=A0AA35Z8F5_LACSI|nr:unnamed protein product [Lactuca saligna]
MEPLISGNLTSPTLANNIRSGDLDRENSEASEEWWHYSNHNNRKSETGMGEREIEIEKSTYTVNGEESMMHATCLIKCLIRHWNKTVRTIPISLGADADEDRIELLLSEVKGKDITELIASGREKLASVPSGGGGGVAVAATGGSGAAPAAAAAAELKKEEKVVEKEESDDVERKSLPHPERPDRLRAIAASLATAENSYLLGTLIFMFDGSWVVGHGSWVMGQVRPPGHHAGVRQAMGFCLHNNAAIAASAAQAAGAKKVLIVDWDVHHGNGTQEIFEQNKTVLYISLHRHEGGKFYPGTGVAHEVGSMGGEGYCVNVPWSR